MVLVLNELDRVRIGPRVPLDRLEWIGRRRDEDEDQEARDREDRDRVEQPANDVGEHWPLGQSPEPHREGRGSGSAP